VRGESCRSLADGIGDDNGFCGTMNFDDVSVQTEHLRAAVRVGIHPAFQSAQTFLGY
jgi:hypothetical protein